MVTKSWLGTVVAHSSLFDSGTKVIVETAVIGEFNKRSAPKEGVVAPHTDARVARRRAGGGRERADRSADAHAQEKPTSLLRIVRRRAAFVASFRRRMRLRRRGGKQQPRRWRRRRRDLARSARNARFGGRRRFAPRLAPQLPSPLRHQQRLQQRRPPPQPQPQRQRWHRRAALLLRGLGLGSAALRGGGGGGGDSAIE